ncbi:Imm52 family immunity protein [Roseivirga seohaensis]|uniref:Imm52 family immunity protein n=1 Tax=Roseivirga seohaensis TaxID=1914963 RepID=UPI003BAB3B23
MDKQVGSVSAIWMSDQKTTISECSKKVLSFLELLKQHNPDLFGRWYEKGRSKKDALKKEVKLDEMYFYGNLSKNWDKKFDDLGARISYWNGHEDESESASIGFTIGAYGIKSFNKNSCVVSLPKGSDFYRSKENQDALISLFDNYWSPNRLLVDGEEV